jgi:hypothetical protein
MRSRVTARYYLAIAGLVTGSLAAAPAAYAAPAAPAQPAQVRIVTFAGKCLDVESATVLGERAAVIQYHCTGQASQRFRIVG